MEYMTVAEACKKWSLSRSWIKALCTQNRIRAKKIGERAWIIEREQPNPKQTKGAN